MNDEIYIQTQQQIIALASIIKDLPLEEFIQKIDLCETIAPMINPTLYLQGHIKLSIIKRIAKATKKLQDEIIKCKQNLEES